MSENHFLARVSEGRASPVGQADRAARAAIARAKARSSAEVTPDDLLLGLLEEVSRFGVVLIGDWAIDIASLDGACSPERCGAENTSRPEYAAETVAVFERGAAIARADSAASAGAVHLLAAFADHDCQVMSELRRRHGFAGAEWRAALARTDIELQQRSAAAPLVSGNGSRGGAGSEILSVDDAAAYLAVHAQTIRNYIRSGKLPAYRLAGERSIRVLRQDLLALLEPVRTDEPDEVENTP